MTYRCFAFGSEFLNLSHERRIVFGHQKCALLTVSEHQFCFAFSWGKSSNREFRQNKWAQSESKVFNELSVFLITIYGWHELLVKCISRKSEDQERKQLILRPGIFAKKVSLVDLFDQILVKFGRKMLPELSDEIFVDTLIPSARAVSAWVLSKVLLYILLEYLGPLI